MSSLAGVHDGCHGLKSGHLLRREHGGEVRLVGLGLGLLLAAALVLVPTTLRAILVVLLRNVHILVVAHGPGCLGWSLGVRTGLDLAGNSGRLAALNRLARLDLLVAIRARLVLTAGLLLFARRSTLGRCSTTSAAALLGSLDLIGLVLGELLARENGRLEVALLLEQAVDQLLLVVKDDSARDITSELVAVAEEDGREVLERGQLDDHRNRTGMDVDDGRASKLGRQREDLLDDGVRDTGMVNDEHVDATLREINVLVDRPILLAECLVLNGNRLVAAQRVDELLDILQAVGEQHALIVGVQNVERLRAVGDGSLGRAIRAHSGGRSGLRHFVVESEV